MTYTRFLSIAHSIAVSLAALAALAALPGCSSDGDSEETLPAAAVCAEGEEAAPEGGCRCPAGTLALESGGCQPAGLPLDMACPPGEMLMEGGRCQAAGVPPEACAEGFVPDKERGCAPILPAQMCPKGLMAVPGETACREVAPCGDGDYGDIPVDSTSEHVNGAYTGSESDGTKEKPWKTIQEGVDAAEPDAIVAVAAGTYAENIAITGKPVRLWGRCPSLVEIKGLDDVRGAVQFTTSGADGAELRDVALTGSGAGVYVSGARDVAIDRLWIHDTAGPGAAHGGFVGTTAVTVTGALIEETGGGIIVIGAQVVVEGVVVRSMRNDNYGTYLEGSSSDEIPTNMVVRSSVIERAINIGIFNRGAAMTLEATVVKDTRPTKSGRYGWGIYLDSISKAQRASGTIKSCVVMGNHNLGIGAEGADVTIEATTVTDTLPDDVKPEAIGIGLQISSDTGQPAVGTIRSSKVTRSRSRGINVVAAEGTIEATLITETLVGADKEEGAGLVAAPHKDRSSNVILRASVIERSAFMGMVLLRSSGVVEESIVRDVGPTADGRYEIGVYVSNGAIKGENEKYLGARSNVMIRSSLLERTRAFGMIVLGSDATVETSTIRDPEPDSDIGMAIYVRDSEANSARGHLVVRSSTVEQAVFSGIVVEGSDALVEGSVIKGTQANAAGVFGDGIAASSPYTSLRGAVTVRDTRIESNQRAGVANFGATVVLETSSMLCNKIDVNGETLLKPDGPDPLLSFNFDDLGGTACGCPMAKEKCRTVSSALAPPKSIDPVSGF